MSDNSQKPLAVGAAVNLVFWVEAARALKFAPWIGAAGALTAMKLASDAAPNGRQVSLGVLGPVVHLINLPGSIAAGLITKKACCASCAVGGPCVQEGISDGHL